MKIDKTTYKDKEEIQIGMTADHTSRPDKVLFFCQPAFFVFCQPTNGTFAKPQKPTHQSCFAKEPFFPSQYKLKLKCRIWDYLIS